eukprot:881846-Pelagomonas_calceolata.AAC.2
MIKVSAPVGCMHGIGAPGRMVLWTFTPKLGLATSRTCARKHKQTITGLDESLLDHEGALPSRHVAHTSVHDSPPPPPRTCPWAGVLPLQATVLEVGRGPSAPFLHAHATSHAVAPIVAHALHGILTLAGRKPTEAAAASKPEELASYVSARPCIFTDVGEMNCAIRNTNSMSYRIRSFAGLGVINCVHTR